MGLRSPHRFREYLRALDPLIDITSALPAIAVSFGISFIRDLAIAAHLGDSPLANAYSIAAAVQAVLVGIATGTINASLAPELARSPAHQQTLLRAALVRAFFASLAIGMVCLGATTALLWRSSFTARLSAMDLAAGCLLFAASIPVLAVGAVTAVRLNSRRRLVLAALPNICAAAGVLTAVSAPTASLTLLGSGLLVGSACGLALAGLIVSRQPYPSAQQSLDRRSVNGAFRKVPDTALAITLASAGTLVDSLILAILLPNSVAAYAYASRIPIGLMAIVNAVSSARIIHIFSELLPQRGVRSTFRRCLDLYVLTICGSLLLAAAVSSGSTSIVRLLFERGRFDGELVGTVAHIQAILIWYLAPALSTQVLNQFVWAIGRNRTLMWISAAMLFLKLTLGAPGAHLFGIEGLAWSQVGILWAVAVLTLVLAARYSRDARVHVSVP